MVAAGGKSRLPFSMGLERDDVEWLEEGEGVRSEREARLREGEGEGEGEGEEICSMAAVAVVAEHGRE